MMTRFENIEPSPNVANGSYSIFIDLQGRELRGLNRKIVPPRRASLHPGRDVTKTGPENDYQKRLRRNADTRKALALEKC